MHISRRGTVSQYVTVTNQAGQWAYYNNGSCDPSRAFPGLQPATFSALGPLRPAARSLALIVQTGTCTFPPAPVARRIDRVVVSWRPHRLLLTVLLHPERPVPSGTVCAGVGLVFELHARLAHALGDRRIDDAVYFPPRPAITRDRSYLGAAQRPAIRRAAVDSLS